MKKIILNIFLSALAPLKWGILALVYCLAISACELEEPYGGFNEGVIEFVARPVGFNNQAVETKAAANNFETAIYNCYFLLFDNDPNSDTYGTLIQRSNMLSSLEPQRIETKGLSKVIACYLVNVSHDFVHGIRGYYKPSDSSANPNHYINTAVLDINYSDANPPTTLMGTPYLDHDNNSSTNNVNCIPMLGIWEGNISNRTTITVPIKRLLAKITLDLRVDLTDLGTLGARKDSFFTLQSYKINNLPKQVALITPAEGEDSNWASVPTDEISSRFTSSVVSLNKQIIYNDDSDNTPKKFTCELYVPEYMLQGLTSDEYYALPDRPEGTFGTQMYKPMAYHPDKHPISLTLIGIFDPGILQDEIGLKYNIFLGGNESNDFTLLRNTKYINTITITGFENSDIDHRVEVTSGTDITEIHGQVANSYIIAEPGDYTILAYKGAHKYSELQNIDSKYLCTKGTSVKVSYKDTRLLNLDASDFNVGDENEDGILEITFNSPSILGLTAAGNMVIDLVYTENGTEYTEWSWHLWFVPNVGVGASDFIELGSHTMPDNKHSKMMDRNIGVTAITSVSSAIGAYYKYGQKEPYFNAKNNQAVYEGNSDAYKPYGGGVIQGHTQTWNTDSKSVTDPCPPGYKVPSSSVWIGYTATDEHSSDPYSYLFYSGVNYPYSGYLNSNNELQTNSNTSQSLTYSGNPIEYKTISTPSPLGIYRRYRNITYEVPLTFETGYIHGAEMTLLYSALTSTSGNWLENLFSSFDITNLEWQEGSITTTRVQTGDTGWPLYIPTYDYIYTLEYPTTWKPLSEIGTLESANYETAKGTVIKSALQANIQESGVEYSESDIISIATNNGYQVRCVKE